MMIEYDSQNRGWFVDNLALLHLARIRKQYQVKYGPRFVDDVLTVLGCSLNPSEEERELRRDLESIPRLQHAAFSRALRGRERKKRNSAKSG